MPRKLASLVAAFCLLLQPLYAQVSNPPPDRGSSLLRVALDEVRAGQWSGARAVATEAGPVAQAIVDWHRLRDFEGDWRERMAFVAQYPDWPGLPFLMQRGEASIVDFGAPAEIVDFFDGRDPATAEGALMLVAALRALGQAEAAANEAIRVWRNMDLSAEEQAALLADFADVLAPHHEERLDTLLWRGARTQVERLLPLMGEGHARLAEARLGLRERVPNVNALIDAVPASLAMDGGLAWERFNWRIGGQLYDTAGDLALERSTSPEALGRPESWANWRAWLVRREMREGDPQRGYELAANHHLESGANFADLEWLAGYIALRYLDDPATALRHFQHLRVNVSAPISLGRAAYWEGRAYEALGDAESAMMAYAFGAEHQTSFYGLLAAEAAGLPMDASLAGDERFPNWRTASFADSTVLEAVFLLHRAGEWHLARRFLLHLAEGLDNVELGQLADLALDMGEPNWALNVAKIAAARGLILPRAYYPLTELADTDLGMAPELPLAIARRESEFDHRVVSPANARGLMQLLPGTAELMARRLGLPYELPRLVTDPSYNAQLGAAYLLQMQEEFGNAPILIAAGYNAGPGRPRTWVQTLGDPRNSNVDAIDWIESVPFTETRNYIMRVMESVYVYRARLEGGPVEIRLSAEINGG